MLASANAGDRTKRDASLPIQSPPHSQIYNGTESLLAMRANTALSRMATGLKTVSLEGTQPVQSEVVADIDADDSYTPEATGTVSNEPRTFHSNCHDTEAFGCPTTSTPTNLGCTSINGCTNATGNCTYADWNGTCLSTSLNWGGDCTSASNCNLTQTRGCEDQTYPKACWFTVKDASCNQTATNGYTCSVSSQTCAANCIKFTSLIGNCNTQADSSFCSLSFSAGCTANIEDCQLHYTQGLGCSSNTWTPACVSTFSTNNCTAAGACLKTSAYFSINCVATSADGACGKTSTAGNVVGPACVISTDPYGGPTPEPDPLMTLVGLSTMLLATVVVSKLAA